MWCLKLISEWQTQYKWKSSWRSVCELIWILNCSWEPSILWLYLLQLNEQNCAFFPTKLIFLITCSYAVLPLRWWLKTKVADFTGFFLLWDDSAFSSRNSSESVGYEERNGCNTYKFVRASAPHSCRLVFRLHLL